MENEEAGCASGSDKRPDKRKKVGGKGKGESIFKETFVKEVILTTSSITVI